MEPISLMVSQIDNDRGHAYVALANLHLGNSGQVPIITDSKQGTEKSQAELDKALVPLKNGLNNKAGNSSTELSEEDKELIRKLQQRDAEVRAHEAAHKAAAGGLATGAASFTTQRGPDGRAYAIGGHVSIDTSAGNTPQETVRKAQQIRAAAMAPSEPSSQDMRVASKASQMEMEAQRKIAETNQNGDQTQTGEPDAAANADKEHTEPQQPSSDMQTPQVAQHHNSSMSHIKLCSDCLGKFFQ